GGSLDGRGGAGVRLVVPAGVVEAEGEGAARPEVGVQVADFTAEIPGLGAVRLREREVASVDRHVAEQAGRTGGEAKEFLARARGLAAVEEGVDELPHLAGLGAEDVRPVLFVPAGDALQGGVEEGERRVVGVAGRELPGAGDDVQWVLVVLAWRRRTRRLLARGRLLVALVVVLRGEQLVHGSAQHVLQNPAGVRTGQSQQLPAVPAVELAWR